MNGRAWSILDESVAIDTFFSSCPLLPASVIFPLLHASRPPPVAKESTDIRLDRCPSIHPSIPFGGTGFLGECSDSATTARRELTAVTELAQFREQATRRPRAECLLMRRRGGAEKKMRPFFPSLSAARRVVSWGVWGSPPVLISVEPSFPR